MIMTRFEQRSDEWRTAKLVKIGGTRLKNVFKSDNLTLIDELISEEGSDEADEIYVNTEMQRGIDLEPVAFELYQEVKGIELEESPNLCLADWSDLLCLSPDAFTLELEGAVELKCPKTKTHVKYIRMNKIPSEYIYQVYTYFLVNNDLEWLDFVSFDPRFKPQPMWVKRVTRDEILEELSDVKGDFLKFEEKYKKYRTKIIDY